MYFLGIQKVFSLVFLSVILLFCSFKVAFALPVTIGAVAETPFSQNNFDPAFLPTPTPSSDGDSIVFGDFTITDTGVDTMLGNGLDETTTWTFDFGSSPQIVDFRNRMRVAKFKLTRADLILVMVAGTNLPGTLSTDLVRINELGLGDINIAAGSAFPALSGIGSGDQFNVQWKLLDFYSSNEILNALAFIGPAQIDMLYGDDALVGRAQLVLTGTIPVPTTFLLVGIGLAGLFFIRKNAS